MFFCSSTLNSNLFRRQLLSIVVGNYKWLMCIDAVFIVIKQHMNSANYK